MKNISSTLLISALTISATSARVIIRPTDSSTEPASHLIKREAPSDLAAQLLKIAPTSNDCSNAQAEFKSECITATDAAQPIISGFAKFSISTAAEQAVLIAWMAFESGEFKFNKHHFPSPKPGQGTRNMMGPDFVRQYAEELNVPGDAEQALDTINQDPVNSFGSAAWFYARKCSDDVKNQVRSGSQAGFEAFTKSCVQTDMASERLQYWQRAIGALGVSTK